jgi:hypothetical protein
MLTLLVANARDPLPEGKHLAEQRLRLPLLGAALEQGCESSRDSFPA